MIDPGRVLSSALWGSGVERDRALALLVKAIDVLLELDAPLEQARAFEARAEQLETTDPVSALVWRQRAAERRAPPTGAR